MSAPLNPVACIWNANSLNSLCFSKILHAQVLFGKWKFRVSPRYFASACCQFYSGELGRNCIGFSQPGQLRMCRCGSRTQMEQEPCASLSHRELSASLASSQSLSEVTESFCKMVALLIDLKQATSPFWRQFSLLKTPLRDQINQGTWLLSWHIWLEHQPWQVTKQRGMCMVETSSAALAKSHMDANSSWHPKKDVFICNAPLPGFFWRHGIGISPNFSQIKLPKPEC